MEPWSEKKFQNEWGFKGMLKIIKREPAQQDALYYFRVQIHWMANAVNKK